MKNKADPLVEFKIRGQWTHLSKFQVMYLGRTTDNTIAHVFRNGHQQVPVQIIIAARNANNELVEMPEADLKKINLVDYYTRTGLVDTEVIPWRVSEFDYYPESLQPSTININHIETANEEELAAIPPPPTNYPIITTPFTRLSSRPSEEETIQDQTFFLYLSTKNVNAMRIGASLPSPIGGVIHTCSSDAAPGGGADGGAFNSSLTINPVPPRHYSASDFTLTRTDYSSAEYLDVDLYEYYLTDHNYQIRRVSYTMTVWEGVYARYKPASRKGYFLYAPPPGDTTVRHVHSQVSWVYADIKVNQGWSLGRASLIRVYEIKECTATAWGGDGQATTVDNYGNESIIRFRSGDGNTIYLSD